MVVSLEQAGAAYVVGGSMASAHHGIPRATNDIDILVDLQISHLPTLLSTLRPEFYLDDQEAMDVHSITPVIQCDPYGYGVQV